MAEHTITKLEVDAYKVPTEQPESDGTLRWDSTTIVIVHAYSGKHVGMGYTYANPAVGDLITTELADPILGLDAFAIPSAWHAMRTQSRNQGHPGVSAMAIAAIDSTPLDLKSRVLDVSLVTLLGKAHDSVYIYGSGGFTSYSIDELTSQLAGWVEQGISRVKMKVGSDPDEDVKRVRAARRAIGDHVELFVDANGAYDRRQALDKAERFREFGVTWFEEPVSSEDRSGLRLLRDRCPAGMEIAAGEYGYEPNYFKEMLSDESIDVLQADVTRCSGITGFQQVSAMCLVHPLPLSAHTAPGIHGIICCGSLPVRHVEYFHDHVRIEQMFFDGVLRPREGSLWDDPTQRGHGLTLKRADAEKFRVWHSDKATD